MVPGRNRYFIALVPPSPHREEIHLIKTRMRDNFGTGAALRSPPHLTLHMPFEWKSGKEDQLIQSLTELGGTLNPLPIRISGFGSFPPRVIFINITATPELILLQKEVRRHCRTKLGLFNAEYRDAPFHPHITIAFRDLKKEAYSVAWADFQGAQWEAEFKATSLTLLRHTGQVWEEFHSMPFRLTPGEAAP